jgi:uncharacterized protein YaeQ
MRKACARARQVVVLNYGGRAADIWWEKVSNSLTRLKNLTVLDIAPDVVETMAAIGERGMRLNVLVQDGEFQLMGERGSVSLRPGVRMAAAD